jgi:phenylacetate-CoA ligase
MRMTVQASKPFSGSQWSEVESVSVGDARRLQDQRLREQLAYLMLGGTVIACTYWGECEAADGMHFLSPDLMVAELIDPETGERVEPAGRTGYKVRCVGRTDDMLIVRGINLFPSAVKDVVLGLRPAATGELRIRADFEGHSTQQPMPLVVEYAADLPAGRRDELRRTVEDRVRSALNVKTVVELVPEGTLKRPDHVKVALIERVHG